VIILSDVHLDKKFDEVLFNKLSHLILQTDQVIINGDFWDSYECTFDEFLNSEWNKLFPLLKSKKTIYLEGNHDPIELMDDRAGLFCSQLVSEYKFKWNDKIIYLTHGHKYKKSIISEYPFLKKSRLVFWVLRMGNKFLDITKLSHLKDLRSAKKLKKKALLAKRGNEIIICGHSHIEEIDLVNGYVNSGEFRHNSTYIEITDEKINLKKYGI
jgi:predicted phosphodiesterase